MNFPKSFELLTEHILSGMAVLFIDGFNEAFSIDVKDERYRKVEESASEPSIHGARDSFTEDVSMNSSLIRRRIRTPALKMENLYLGTLSKTQITIVYLDGIANSDIVNEVKERLSKIITDSITHTTQISEVITDDRWSLFPLTKNSDRPDLVSSKILEGVVCILVDNCNYALLVPVTVIDMLKSQNDYTDNFYISSFARMIRVLTFFSSILLPSLYVSVINYHQELLPTSLLISIAGLREGRPLPILVEVLLMEVVFEMIREAAYHLPRGVGSAVSIVGTLVIGEGAVRAGIITSSTVIIVSLTAIASFSIPTMEGANLSRILKFFMILASSVLGLLGVAIGMLFILGNACTLRSFGISYMMPFSPTNWEDLKDTLIRVPFWSMIKRPKLISKNNIIRRKTNQKSK